MSRFCIVDFKVTARSKVVFTVNTTDLDNGRLYDLCFEPCKYDAEYEKLIGNEKVYIKPGCNGKEIPVLTGIGNMFYGGRLEKCPRVYRLAYGNDGYAEKIQHFECVNTPCCSFYDPGNINDNCSSNGGVNDGI